MRQAAATFLFLLAATQQSVAAKPDPIVLSGGSGADIANAIREADQRTQAVAPKIGGGTWSRQGPVVELRGVFRVNEPIPMPQAVRLSAEGAVLDCRGMADGGFVFDGGGWRCEVSGSMTLVDAPNGIRWNTGTMKENRTLGMSRISGVHFAGVRGVAIDLQCRSSVVVIERCVFDQAHKILHNRMCDDVTVRNCFANMADAPGVAPITTEHGRLTMRGGVYTPPRLAKTAGSLAWIEVLGARPGVRRREQMVLLNGVRFGGEYGGMSVVLNRSAGRIEYPAAPGVCITLRDLNASNALSPGDRKAGVSAPLVLLEELPNHLLIDGCYGMVRPKHLVDFAPGVDGAELVGAYSPTGVNNRCTIQLQRHNTIKHGNEAPKILKKFVVGPAAGGVDN